MSLKKVSLVTLSALFLTTACGSESTSSAQADDKIQSLEAELKQAKADNEQLSTKLKELDAKDSETVKVDKNQATYDDKTVLGQVEWTYIKKAEQNFQTRVDTGASTSSLNAVDIEEFERDSKKWVRFNITHKEGGAEKVIEAPIVRTAKILQSNSQDESSERPVIELKVSIAGIDTTSEFTLTDRTSLDYPVLLGRTFIKDVVLVDVSQEFIHPKYKSK